MIRRVLRVLGSRYGIAAVLILVVIGAVAIAGTDDRGPVGNANTSDPSIEPGAPDDGYAPPPSAEPEPSGGDDSALPDAAVDVAAAFAAAWIDVDRSPEDWRAALVPFSTPLLVEQLAEADPVTVPAREIRGDPVPRNGLVEFDTDAGLLILRVTTHDGSWYVDGIDFHRP